MRLLNFSLNLALGNKDSLLRSLNVIDASMYIHMESISFDFIYAFLQPDEFKNNLT